MYAFSFGPWYCGQCEKRIRCLPRVRSNQPTIQGPEAIGEEAEKIGNFIRSDSSLVLRKKRSSRYTNKYREGVVQRLLSGKVTIAQLTTELKVTESDLMSWVSEMMKSRDQRIADLTGLLDSYLRVTSQQIGITDESPQFDADENLIDAEYERRVVDLPPS